MKLGDLGKEIISKITDETLGKSNIRFTNFDYNLLKSIDITEALKKAGYVKLDEIEIDKEKLDVLYWMRYEDLKKHLSKK